jgi:hypothetical protein
MVLPAESLSTSPHFLCLSRPQASEAASSQTTVSGQEQCKNLVGTLEVCPDPSFDGITHVPFNQIHSSTAYSQAPYACSYI